MIALGLFKHHFKNRIRHGTPSKGKHVSENIHRYFAIEGGLQVTARIRNVSDFEAHTYQFTLSQICD